MPNGILRNLNLPNGVLNVVSLEESLCRGICQNELLASNVENTGVVHLRSYVHHSAHGVMRAFEHFV